MLVENTALVAGETIRLMNLACEWLPFAGRVFEGESMNNSSQPFISPLERRVFLSATLVADLTGDGVDPKDLTSANQQVYFSGTTRDSGRELWVSDGTTSGTRQVIDLNVGPADAEVTNLTAVGSSVFFAARGTDGWGLYRSDGAAAGTRRLLALGSASDFANPKAMGSVLMFQRPDKAGYALWKSDGTVAGTVKVAANLSQAPFIAVAADAFLIGVDSKPARPKLYFSDGSTNGTRELTYQGSTVVGFVTILGANAYFSAGDNQSIQLFHLDQSTRITPVMTQDKLPLSGATVIPVAAKPGGRPYAFVVEKNTGDVTLHQIRSSSSSVQIDVDSMPGLLPPDAAMALTSRNDYFFTAGSGYAPQIWRVDHNARAVYPVSDNFRFTGSDFLFDQQIESVLDVGRIGESFFGVVETLDKKRFYIELDPVRQQAHVLQSIDKPENILDDGLVGTNRGAFFPGTDSNGVRGLYFRAPGGETIALANALSSPDDPGILAHAMTNAGMVIARRGQFYQVVIELIRNSGQRETLVTFGEKTNRALGIVLYGNGETIAYLLTFRQTASRTTSHLLQTMNLTNNRLGVWRVPTNAKLLGVRANQAVIEGDDPVVAGKRFVGVSRTPAGITVPLPSYSRFATFDAGDASRLLSAEVGSWLFTSTGTDLFRSQGASSGRSVKGTNIFESPIHSLTSNATDVFAANQNAIYHFNEASGAFGIWLTTDGMGDGATIQSIATGDWIYVVVADATGQWRLLKIDPANAANRVTIAQRDASWRAAGLGTPKIAAARMRDVLLTVDYFQRTTVVAVRNDVLDLTTKRSGLETFQVLTWQDSILLQADSSLLFRLRNGNWTTLKTPADIDQLQVDSSGLSFLGATPNAGRGLFRYRFDTTITGTIYNDRNANLSRDAGERGLSGWRVYVDSNDNGRYDRNEPSTLTDASGNFEFFELDPGTYKLRISTGASYQMTTGSVYTVKLVAGTNVRKKFGARAIA